MQKNLRQGLEYLIFTTALALAIPFNSINAQQQAQQNQTQQNTITNTQTTIKARTDKNGIMYKDTCDCPPKYKELNFLRNTNTSSFAAKEMWTLDKGNGTDLLTLYCDSTNVNNLLELMDFKDKSIKNNILSRNYTTIEDNLNREYMELETKNGTRYFTIQTRDEENKNIIDVDGTIHYDALRNHGNKMLRLYVQMGKSAGIDPKTGKIKIHSLDSGDLIIPYYDCVQPIISSNIKLIPDTSNVRAANITNTTINNYDYSTRINITIENSSKPEERVPIPILLDTLNSNRLIVSVLGSFANDATQKKLYECGEFDINTKPMLWKLAAYARTLNKLHLNAEFTHIHGAASLVDPNKNNIGDYGITADDLLLDARLNFFKSRGFGLGIGGIFEYNASTQKGFVQANTRIATNYTLDANDSRVSGLLGLVLFAGDAKLSAGVYAGHSSLLGTLFNATARLNDIQIGKALDINSRLFFEMYGNYGKGNRAGFEALVSGPLIFGILRPTIGYEIVNTIYSGKNLNLETGLRSSILVGITADFGGERHKSSHK
jgi:hypothetical protein